MRERLAAFLADEAARYGSAPALECDGAVVRGWVVTREQHRRLQEVGGDVEVGVLADAEDERTTVAWGRVPVRTPIFASFQGKLATEVLPHDPPLRMLRFPERGHFVLVETACRTIGWLDRRSVEELPEQLARRAYLAPRRAARGHALAVSSARLGELRRDGERLAGAAIPYCLGGRDRKRGLDCSALSQLLFSEHLDILLPRHSRDQRRCGVPVRLSELAPGVLLFAHPHGRKLSHVALALSGRILVHACLSKGRVICEHIESFFERYQFKAARRIGEAV